MKNNRIYISLCLIICLIISAVSIPAFAAKQKKQQKDFVVVIDAGHGGTDVGAIENGVKEKDVNLAVAQMLEEMLKKKKGFKVIMTRNSDKTLGLKDRAAKANKEKADLFISIHTNSVDEKNPNRGSVEGASVYVLGLHRDADNLEVSRRENSVIAIEKNSEEKYEGFNPNQDESYIIFEMAQKKNLSQSIGLAQNIEQQLVKVANRKSRGVHQAGFLVLRETAMPSVLVELDFVCNPNVAKYLSSSTGQKQMARAIATAVVEYRNNLLKNGADSYSNLSLDNEQDNVDGEFYVLPPTRQSDTRQYNSASTNSKNRPAQRRRRSQEAKQKSSQRDLQTAKIKVLTEDSEATLMANAKESKQQKALEKASAKVNTQTQAKGQDPKKQSSKKNTKTSKNNKNNNKTQTRIVGGKQVAVASNDQASKQTASKTASQPAKQTTAQTTKQTTAQASKQTASKNETATAVNHQVQDSFKAASEDNSSKMKSHRSLKSKKK